MRRKFKDFEKQNDNIIYIQCANDSENLKVRMLQKLREGSLVSFSDFREELESIEKEFSAGKP